MTNCQMLLERIVTDFQLSCAIGEFHDGCRVSLPLETTGGHRVEVLVRQVSPNTFVLSDMGRTLSELLSYGVDPSANTSRQERLTALQRELGVERIESEFQAPADARTLPAELLRFGNAMKTIGDMAFLHRVTVSAAYRLYLAVRSTLTDMQARFNEGKDARVPGVVEREHQLDFVGDFDNRRFGIAVVGGRNPRQVAEAWAFRFYDIREKNPTLKRVAVYDDEQPGWREPNVKILSAMAEAAIPGSSLGELVGVLRAA